jgi:photosystem II stability/assembly factor-like uncharacterized protein
MLSMTPGTRAAFVLAAASCTVALVPVTASATGIPAIPSAIGPAGLPGPAVPTTPTGTIWAGWDAPGPSGVGRPRATGHDGTVLIVGSESKGGLLPFRVSDARGTRLGRVAAPADAVPAASGRRLYLSTGCRVLHSGDGGASWSSTSLPWCDVAGPTTGMAVTASGDTAWVGDRYVGTWRTGDGGETWTRIEAGTSAYGPPVPASATLGYRFSFATHLGSGFERTTDGGTTWQGLGYTGLPRDGATRGSFYNVLSGNSPLAVRPDGTLLVGTGATLVVVAPGESVGTSVPVPVPEGLGGTGEPSVVSLVCDPAGTCVVGVGREGAGRAVGLVLRDGTFGEQVAAPSSGAFSPAPGVILAPGGATPQTGVTGVLPGSVLRSDDLGATPYRTAASYDLPVRSIGTNGTLAIPAGDDLHVSTDHGGTWRHLPLPAAPTLTQVAGAGDDLVALADDGSLLRFTGDRWSPVAGLSSLEPRSVVLVEGVPVVVGDRGVVRLSDPADPQPVPSPSPAGRGFPRVTASGRTVVAWDPEGREAVRSTDGGVTWTRFSTPVTMDDLQLASPTVAYGLHHRDLYVSRHGGRGFARVSTAPALGTAGQTNLAPPGPLLSFSSAKRGTLITPAGLFLTGNGGRSLEAVPTPDALRPPTAAVAGNGVSVQDPLTGVVLRNATLLRSAPTAVSVSASRVTRRSRSGSRTVRVVGRVAGAGVGEPVAVLRVARGGSATAPGRVVRTGTKGRFVAAVRLPRSARGVRVVYRGSVRTDRTSRSGASRILPVR